MILTRPALLLLAAVPLVAQEPPSTSPLDHLRSGPMVAGTANIHRGSFETYDGVLECARFERAITPGWLAGYSLEVPLSGPYSVSARASFWKADGDFTAPNPYDARIALSDGTVVPLESEHRLETLLEYVTLEVLARWRFSGPFYAAIGPGLGLASRAAYEQEEAILSPSGVTFATGQTERKIIAGNFDEQGTLPTRSEMRIAAVAAIGADLVLSDRFVLSPEVGFAFGVTNVLSSFDWTAHAVRAGVGLTYAMTPPAADREIPGPPLEPVLAFDVRSNLRDGRVLDHGEIAIAEEIGTDLQPLLPYVFFDSDAATIPARYHRLSASQAAAFDEAGLVDSTLGVYHAMLDIVGSRLRRHPAATITVTGCREPLDDRAGGDALSRSRAEAVKSYLVQTHAVAPERIQIATRELPAEPSNRAYADGREENRRAEISSSDPRIVAPVVRRVGSRSVEPVSLDLLPRVANGGSIRRWDLSLSDESGAQLYHASGDGAPDERRWDVNAHQVLRSLDGHRTGALTAELVATLEDGRSLRAERSVPVRHTVQSRRLSGEVVSDSLIERYNLIFFDFDTPRISDFNRPVMELIHARMKTTSSVRVTGLTDRTGDESHNLELASRRADAAGARIRDRIVPDRLESLGAGERLIYNNDLPEGRMYNRTVVIEIATPLEVAP